MMLQKIRQKIIMNVSNIIDKIIYDMNQNILILP